MRIAEWQAENNAGSAENAAIAGNRLPAGNRNFRITHSIPDSAIESARIYLPAWPSR
jgi:hypothetical protein